MTGWRGAMYVYGFEFPTVPSAQHAARTTRHVPATCSLEQDAQFVLLVGEDHDIVGAVAGRVVEVGGKPWDVPLHLAHEARVRRLRARLQRSGVRA